RCDEQREAGHLEVLDGQIASAVGHGLDAARAVDDGAESEKQIEDGKGSGNDVDAAPEVLANVGRSHARSSISAITVRPTFTFSRIRTLMVAAGEQKTSTRDPNLIMPIRSPRTTSSPSFLSKTIRRASSPALCLTPTVRPRPSST